MFTKKMRYNFAAFPWDPTADYDVNWSFNYPLEGLAPTYR